MDVNRSCIDGYYWREHPKYKRHVPPRRTDIEIVYALEDPVGKPAMTNAKSIQGNVAGLPLVQSVPIHGTPPAPSKSGGAPPKAAAKLPPPVAPPAWPHPPPLRPRPHIRAGRPRKKICRGGACEWSPCEYCSRSEPRKLGSVAAAARRPRENLRRRSNLYIHSRA